MTTPKKKTILDYFSQSTLSSDNLASEPTNMDDSFKPNASQSHGTDASVDIETPKKMKKPNSRMIVESSDSGSIEQLDESCIFSSSSTGSPGSNTSMGKTELKRPSVCSGLDNIKIDTSSTRESTKLSTIIADFLGVETTEFDTVEPTFSLATDPDIPKHEERYEFLVNIRDKSMKRRGEEGYDPTTLHIPNKYYQRFTPFEKQFWDIKSKHYDTVIFFKKGKFYELYEDDAEIASRLFDLRITDRVNMRMAGFPEISYETWAAKFLSHGYKIGKVAQAENAIGKKLREQDGKKDKIISRELKEIITQGTIYNNEHIASSFPFYIAAIAQDPACYSDRCSGPFHFSIVLYDASINKFFTRSFCDSSDMNGLKSIFIQNDIKEVITDLNITLPYPVIVNKPIKTMIVSQRKYDFKNDREFLCFGYLYEYMRCLCRESCLDSAIISNVQDDINFMNLDGSTLQNMDILVNNFDNSDNGTLIRAINHCSTPFGQRLLRKWVVSPLTNIEKILERRSYVEMFSSGSLDDLVLRLKDLGDIERYFGKLSNSNPSFKDLSAFVSSLGRTKAALQALVLFFENRGHESQIDMVKNCLKMVNDIIQDFDRTYKIVENDIIPGKENDELFVLDGKLNSIRKNLENYIQSLRDSTGIKELNYKSIGKEVFQIESPSNATLPPHFFIVSSTKTHRRFYSKELKDVIHQLVETEERIFQSQGSILRRAVDLLKQHSISISQVINYLASVDCFISFCKFDKIYKTTKPIFSEKLEIINFANPIYEEHIKNTFKPKNRITLITGPNMGGKSTYLRSICLNIILAQIGMNVPCEFLSLPVFDKIFTRIGASDSLAKGESTFMIEMNEASKILNHSTSRSFVIMDELGRGTSTKDGEAIAKAVLDYCKRIGCCTLFSTHYHKLVEDYEGVDKSYVKCKIDGEDIVFLYKVDNGICPDSHGLHVARLAGVPEGIIRRSLEIRDLLLNKPN